MAMGVSGTDASTNVNNGNSSTATYTFDCIGYGTIMAPGHTYSNVIMTRIVYDLPLFDLVSYIWYDSDNGMPVFNYVPGDGGFIPEAAIYLNSVTTSAAENNFAAGLKYTNPVTTSLRVNLYTEKAASISYQLRNSLGEVVSTGRTATDNLQKFELNMANQPAGIYFLTVSDAANVSSSRSVKIIKQ
jgi:hypothetical protein